MLTALLALGHIDVIAEADLKVWDWVALLPIIEGAGGRLTDWSGGRLRADGDGRALAVGDPALLDQAVALLRRIGTAAVAALHGGATGETAVRHSGVSGLLERGGAGRKGASSGPTASRCIGEPQLPPDFKNFPYVNPDAPKGGEVALGDVGTFDSFNPFIVRGTAGRRVRRGLGHAAARQRRRGLDRLRPARADDRGAGRSQLCRLRAAARGEVPRRHAGDRRGRRLDVQHAARARAGRSTASTTATSPTRWPRAPSRVVFHFKTNTNRELPLILGEMPVLPKHWWQGRDFAAPLTEPPLGSGPYRDRPFRVRPHASA